MKNSSKLTEVVLDGKNIEFLLLKKSIESKLSLISSMDEKPYNLPDTVDKVLNNILLNILLIQIVLNTKKIG